MWLVKIVQEANNYSCTKKIKYPPLHMARYTFDMYSWVDQSSVKWRSMPKVQNSRDRIWSENILIESMKITTMPLRPTFRQCLHHHCTVCVQWLWWRYCCYETRKLWLVVLLRHSFICYVFHIQNFVCYLDTNGNLSSSLCTTHLILIAKTAYFCELWLTSSHQSIVMAVPVTKKKIAQMS